jgi:hypothetical protein
LSREVYCLDLDQRCMNLPITDAFELGELFLRRFDCLLSAKRRPNDDRPLATADKLIGSRDFIQETHAIARHLSAPSFISNLIMTRRVPASMIWINDQPIYSSLEEKSGSGQLNSILGSGAIKPMRDAEIARATRETSATADRSRAAPSTAAPSAPSRRPARAGREAVSQAVSEFRRT